MNRPCVQRTVFQDFGKEEKTYGFRIYDDHGQSYGNMMKEEDLKLSDQEFLELAVDLFDDAGTAIFDFALERGIYVDDHWYQFDLDGEDWTLINPS